MTQLPDWHGDNQRHLSACLARVIARLEAGPEHSCAVDDTAAVIRESMQWPPALEVVAERFDLSDFEQGILLMCAGVELDSAFSERLAALGGGRAAPSFGLALARLPDAHWSALAPASPLRRWRLVEPSPGASLTDGRLLIDERILHFLTGVQYLDERLRASVEPLEGASEPPDTHRDVARAIVDTVQRCNASAPLPVMELLGTDAGGKRAVAAEVARELGVELFVLPVSEIPASGSELHAMSVLWGREVALAGRALFIDAEDLDESGASTRDSALSRFIDAAPGVVLVASTDRRRMRFRALRSFDVERPRPGEQRALWTQVLAGRGEEIPGELHRVASQFRLGLDALRAAGTEVAGVLSANGSNPDAEALAVHLWDACRRQARPRLDDLAQRIEPIATWADLVVPDEVEDALRQIAVHARHRHLVHESWKLGERSARGLGISALFAGASGTGKTMAAEVLANELRLDLYRIDVASVVSKYIGETEKNLRRVFDTAEEGGAILLFDEADALFGKRSEVKDSHDRFANIEVSYLLQRMESYKGLAVLTTNMKSALDQAFLRRLRFVIEFPFPDAPARRRIWEGMFPREAPTRKLDLTKLSHLNISGGNIRNIVLGAAFNAAEEGVAIGMQHVFEAAKREYRKLDKSLQSRETRGWE
jgi:hypothetical protein